ncbi:serine/threonine-protein kinase RIPK-like [Euphorbia lathyris]|uniref:serine/threonine-protein kinase RIPK-like n=1 Tax=Euphorbia lathyris TaxID=212925 RepID=UPI0033130D7F
MGNFLCCSSSPTNLSHDEECGNEAEVINFTVKELNEYTDEFNRKKIVGHGDFGPVYRGTIKARQERHLNCLDVAVKHSHTKDDRSAILWKAEVEYLPRVVHKNIIKLIGYCETEERFYLVYPFMPNGTVLTKLQDLKWSRILKIIKGIASGIQKLHSHHPPLIHGNISLNNILLDKDFTPKLGDFGTVTPQGKQSQADDIYNLGVMILQIIMKEENASLPGVSIRYHICDRARSIFEERGHAVHQNIGNSGTACSKRTITKLGLDCVNHDSSLRPNIAQVLQILANL